MGSDVETNVNGGVVFTVEEARALNALCDGAGGKGSAAKRVLASAQEKVEQFLPPEDRG
jgi:hypothetical protein